MSICLIDSSVFCNILQVPQMDQHREQAMDELAEFIQNGWSLLLPLATIYETGNHIAKAANGGRRRRVAATFVEQVVAAFGGKAPWTPTPIHLGEDLTRWLGEYPDSAMRGVGLADLSIVKTFEEQCDMHPMLRVRIWSYDNHLSAYDRRP